jgi:hypothetical protein
MSLDCSGSYLDKSMVESTAREARTAGDDMLRDKRGRLQVTKEWRDLVKRRTRDGLMQEGIGRGAIRHLVRGQNGSTLLGAYLIGLRTSTQSGSVSHEEVSRNKFITAT